MFFVSFVILCVVVTSSSIRRRAHDDPALHTRGGLRGRDGRRDDGRSRALAATGRSGRDRIAPACRRRPACCRSGRASGPPVVWTASGLGTGYGSVAVKGDRIFVQGDERTAHEHRRPRSTAPTARRVWSKALGPAAIERPGAGPRGTPTVDGDRLYVLTENGDLACLKTDGTAVWQRNILKDFGGRRSPLADQRVAARRRHQRHRHARRTAAPAWWRSTR